MVPKPLPAEDDPFLQSFDIGTPLIADDADGAAWCIDNAVDADGAPENHRIYLTGYDRSKTTAVRGRLFHVVHGVMGGPGNSSRPATLVVFEWLLVPGALGRRFREVNIDVTFAAHGRRPGVRRGGDLSGFAPAPVKVAPHVPVLSAVSKHNVTVEKSVAGKVMLGYPPFVSGGPEVGRKSTKASQKTDFRFMAGYPAFVKKTYGEPNSVHWTLQENGSNESGLPSLVRTAVLLQRDEDDHTGIFTASIKTSAKASLLADGIEAVLKLVKLVPNDEPVYFDPKPVRNVSHGAAVLYGSKDVSGLQCPFAKENLAAVDLSDFLVPDDDTEAAESPASEESSGPGQQEQQPSVGAEIQASVEF